MAIQGSLEEEPKPNLDEVIDSIQVESIKLIEPIVVTIKSSQHFQPIVEHVHVKNPQFSIS
jgi:hypothetical protein